MDIIKSNNKAFNKVDPGKNGPIWAKASNGKKKEELIKDIIKLFGNFSSVRGLPKGEALKKDLMKQKKDMLYSKYLGLLVASTLKKMKKDKADEAVRDMYLYASSQLPDAGFHLKLQ